MSTTTATVIIATLAIVCTFASMIWVTVTLRQALREMSRSRSLSDIRHSDQIEKLLDRLTTIHWEDFAALTAIQDKEEVGGFLTPEEQTTEAAAVVQVQEPGRWGPLSRRAKQDDLTANEQALLEEDFSEDR
jgi:hypothetical protein